MRFIFFILFAVSINSAFSGNNTFKEVSNLAKEHPVLAAAIDFVNNSIGKVSRECKLESKKTDLGQEFPGHETHYYYVSYYCRATNHGAQIGFTAMIDYYPAGETHDNEKIKASIMLEEISFGYAG